MISNAAQIKEFLETSVWRKLKYFILGRLFSRNLNMLAKIYKSDKSDRPGSHAYTKHYSKYFHELRHKKLKILEIGVGGYESLQKGGASLRMWKRYFTKSMIYSIDIYDKSALCENRIKIFQGSQADDVFLKDVGSKIGPLDIIIDDGSHVVSHVLATFKTLFPLLNDGGIYVIEDIQTFYWPNFGGNSENLDDPRISMNFFKSLADGLNYSEFLKPNYIPSYFDKNIVSVHFYHNLIFIFKGNNNETSNMVENGKFRGQTISG